MADTPVRLWNVLSAAADRGVTELRRPRAPTIGSAPDSQYFSATNAGPSSSPGRRSGASSTASAASPCRAAPSCRGSSPRMCARQFRRARCLSSERRMVPGRVLGVGRREHPVARARVLVPARPRFEVHRRQLPLPQRIVDAGGHAALLLRLPDLQPELDQLDAVVGRSSSRPAGRCRGSPRTRRLLQNPMTCSMPARLYQLRSNTTISPAAGKCAM